jgi:hypothetical protein
MKAVNITIAVAMYVLVFPLVAYTQQAATNTTAPAKED